MDNILVRPEPDLEIKHNHTGAHTHTCSPDSESWRPLLSTEFFKESQWGLVFVILKINLTHFPEVMRCNAFSLTDWWLWVLIQEI